MLTVTSVRHSFPECAGFSIVRPNGHQHHTFLHFYDSIDILQNGQWVHTAPHACILYKKDTPQFFNSKQDLIHDWLHFVGDCDILADKYGIKYNEIFYPNNIHYITNIVKELETEFFSPSCFSEDFFTVKIYELFLKLAINRENTAFSAPNSDAERCFEQLRTEIFYDLKRNWTIEEMAKSVGLSKSRFYTVYKGIYGNTPIDDIIHSRIHRAKEMLCNRSYSISQIAEELGYNNITHFMRQFKKITGETPNEYRKNNE